MVKAVKLFSIIMILISLSFSMAFAARRGRPKVDSKDFSSTAKVEVLRTQVAKFINDKGPKFEALSKSMSQIVEKCGRVSEPSVRAKAIEALDSALKGIENAKEGNPHLDKIGEVWELVFDQAIGLRESTINSKAETPETTKDAEATAIEISELMFSLAGQRLPEKVENPDFKYSIKKIEDAAEIVRTELGTSNPTAKSVLETKQALLEKFNQAETIKDILKCERG